MSNHKDNNSDKRLKAFLAKSKKASESAMDDFEKEALEGFEGVESEDEIMALKAKMDKRAYAEIFTQEEKKSSPVFWYAAAGLVLIIGFSVYFIKNDPSTQKNDLAIHEKKEVLNAVEETPQEEVINESLAKFTSVDSSPTLKKDQIKAESNKSIALKTNQDINREADIKASEAKALEETEDVSYDENSAGVTSASPILTKKDNAQITDQEVKKKSPAAGVTPAAAPQNEMIVSTKEEEKSLSLRKNRKKPEARSKQADAAFAEDSFISSCYYTGGEEALLKDLKILLEEKNLLLKFNATLFINENKKVEKVVITNSFGMTENQLKKVEEVLKQLSRFNLNNPSSSRSLAEYQLVFKP